MTSRQKQLVENYVRQKVKKMLKEEESYKDLANKTPAVGKTITFSVGRFKDEPGKILKPAGSGINAWIVELKDKVKVMVFPTDIKTVNEIPYP